MLELKEIREEELMLLEEKKLLDKKFGEFPIDITTANAM